MTLALVALGVSCAALLLALMALRPAAQPAAPNAPYQGGALRADCCSLFYAAGVRFPVGTILLCRSPAGALISASEVNSSGLACFKGLAPGVTYGVYCGDELCAYVRRSAGVTS
jgi:hypothetical protein